MLDCQKRALENYRKKKKIVTIQFCPTEFELYDMIQKQPNKQGYVKGLIRKDIEGTKKES